MNFEVKENEIVGFLGPNGAGKTTTMNMITGYIEPTEGQIYINGYDIQKQPKQAKKQIGYMSENSALYPDFTVKEFITYLADLKRVDKKEKNIEHIIVFCQEPHTLQEIAQELGFSDRYWMKKNYIDPLLGDMLQMTSVESKNAPTQKYVAI